jgi:putative hydrolase of the HAD superfamily
VSPTPRAESLPRGLLLDLDDTILDDSGTIAASWREACVTHQNALGAVDAVAVYEEIERVRDWYWGDAERHRVGRLNMPAARRQIVDMSLSRVGIEDARLATVIADAYGAAREHGFQPFEQAVETLEWLKLRGCRLALLTNGAADTQRGKIERHQLARFFDVILIEGELGFGKPDPRIYQLALDRLVIRPADAWMIGDNLEWDVALPQRLGMVGVWVDIKGAGLPSDSTVRPDRIVRRLADLRTRN